MVGDITNNAVTTYARGTGLIGMTAPDGTVSRYVKNGHGDVVGLVNAGGSVVTRYGYDAFGNPSDTNGLQDSNPFRYCGEYNDFETGFLYLRARYYDPGIGRFISEDPVGAGLNWYVYCENDPVNRIDPEGLDAIFITDQNALYQQAGHSSVIMQDKNNSWWYCYWGNKEAVYIQIPDGIADYMFNVDFFGGFNNWICDTDRGEAQYGGAYTSWAYVEGDFTSGLEWYKSEIDAAGTMGNNNPNNMYSLLDKNCSQMSTKSMSMGILPDGTSFSNYIPGYNAGLEDPVPNGQINNIAWGAVASGYGSSYVGTKHTWLWGLITWYY